VPDSHSPSAEELLAQGRVTDVRILQGGKVITGVIAPGAEMPGGTDANTGGHSRQRVYIRHPGASLTTATHAHRMQSLSTRALQVECSCGAGNPSGAGNPCAHVIAVSIAAERASGPDLGSRDSTPVSMPRTSGAASSNAAATQQRLYYLMEGSDTLDEQHDSRGTIGGLRLSIWVGQATAGGSTLTPSSAQPFTARSSSGAHPRYVDEQDKEVLRLLVESRADSTMTLSGETGARLLRKIVATGRSRWLSLDAPALRWDSPRNAKCGWETLPDGTQRLRCDLKGTARIGLELDPFLYIDAAAARCSPVELAVPVALLRLSGIYGPGRNALVQLADGTARRLVKPGQIFNRIHVADIAAAVAAAAARKAAGVFNVTDDEPAPPQDVVAYAAEPAGYPLPPEIDFATADLPPMVRSFYGENKRVGNGRLAADLGVTLAYPTYREGIAALWKDGSWRG